MGKKKSIDKARVAQVMIQVTVALILLGACDFNFLASTVPNISSANGAVIPAGPAGSIVVVRGAGFGDVQGSGRLSFTPIGGGVPLFATIATWGQAAIVGTVPAGAPGNFAVSVLSGNGITSGGLLFTVTPPMAPSSAERTSPLRAGSFAARDGPWSARTEMPANSMKKDVFCI